MNRINVSAGGDGLGPLEVWDDVTSEAGRLRLVVGVPLHWISVNDRLPEPEVGPHDHKDYIVAYASGEVGVGYYLDYGARIGHAWGPDHGPVTHWMPLPEPPNVKR